MPAGSRGVVLLEAIVALAVFGAVALSTTSLLLQAGDSVRRAQRAEAALLDADRLMTAISLVSGADLEERLGRRVAGEYAIEIHHVGGMLYRVSLEQDGVGLSTLLYRPGARQ